MCCNLAAMFRASRVTLTGWTDSWKVLVSSLSGLSLEGDLSSSMSPACWDSCPIAARLLCAHNGFTDNFLGCIPKHILKRIQGSFHDLHFLRPHVPPVLPSSIAPWGNPIFEELEWTMRFHPDKPQKRAFHVFHSILHPTPLQDLVFARTTRWMNKYFNTNVLHSQVGMHLDLLSVRYPTLLTLPRYAFAHFALPGPLAPGSTALSPMFSAAPSAKLAPRACPTYWHVVIFWCL